MILHVKVYKIERKEKEKKKNNIFYLVEIPCTHALFFITYLLLNIYKQNSVHFSCTFQKKCSTE
jgi:hypothetical protein